MPAPLKRTKRTPLTHAGFPTPKFAGYTDAKGNRTADAPKNWPFGRIERVPLKATKRNPIKRVVKDEEFGS